MKRSLFCILILLICSIFIFTFLKPIFIANELIIPYGLKPFDICQKNPILWKYLKIAYVISFVFSNVVCSNFLFSRLFKNSYFFFHKKNRTNQTKDIDTIEGISLLIGKNEKEDIYICEKGLYQNFLITGTIGTGKTSSAMYPFTEQFIKYNYLHPENKLGMLILDVKGNYFNQVKKYVEKYSLTDDLIIIELGGNAKYNPLNKPDLKSSVLANRLRTILELFSDNNSESYWLDKAEQILNEAIKLCRIYNNGYVTFKELHKIITVQEYYKEKIHELRNLFISGKLKDYQIYELNTALEFFQNEFEKLDERTANILKSEITRITNTFISDFEVINTFCADEKSLTFKGFNEVLNEGKIVVLNMNIAEYRNLSKIIAAYLKLDFQNEVMKNLSKGKIKASVFICDEYAEYVNKTDSDFFSLSREAKCINIVSTQSYSSIKKALKDDDAVKVICQNLINKIWFRTDDIYTIEEAQKQLGKEEKTKTSKNISENAKETKYDYLTNSLINRDSTISESFNFYTQNDFIYDTNFFTQKLETFYALCFLSDGSKILKPEKIQMYPYFIKEENNPSSLCINGKAKYR